MHVFVLRLGVDLVWSVAVGDCLMKVVAMPLPTQTALALPPGELQSEVPGALEAPGLQLGLSAGLWSELPRSGAHCLCGLTGIMFEWIKGWEQGSEFSISVDLKSLVFT